MELSTPQLIDLVSRHGMLRLGDLVHLQGVVDVPRGGEVAITITAAFPDSGEVEVSQDDGSLRARKPLGHVTLADAGWFPSASLARRIEVLRAEVAQRPEVDLAVVMARLDAERARAETERQAAAHHAACDAALKAALAASADGSAGIADWHLVLQAMAARREALTLRDDREIEFFEGRLGSAREYGPGLRNSEKQIAWQGDILRRSAAGLRSALGL